MEIVAIESTAMLQVAALMARIKPDWWPRVEDAVAQLEADTQGWYLAGPDGEPRGWLSCILLAGYRAVEIDVMGYDDHNALTVGPPLEPLVAACEAWSRSLGTAYIRFISGSGGMPIQGRQLGSICEELCRLDTSGRPDVTWLRSLGFEPAGLLPNTYGEGYHGIMLIKRLVS